MNHSTSSYNQIANFVIAQSEINIAIGARAPVVYFGELAEQVKGGPQRYGGITEREHLEANLAMNCVPVALLDGEVPTFEAFLAERRKLMALKLKTWFESL